MSVQAVVAGRRADFTSLEAGRQPVKLRQPARNSNDVVCVTAAGASWSRLPTPEPMALDDIVIGRRVATTRGATTMRYEASSMKSVACLRLMSRLTRVELCHWLLAVCYKDDYQCAANQNSLVVKKARAIYQAALKRR